MSGLFIKLAKIQNQIKVNKSQYNKFGGYYYRSCEDIFEALKPICSEYNVCFSVSDELVCIDGRFYVKATATIIDVDTSERYSVSAFAREAENKKGMDESQITGASSSYARKYALNGLLLLDDVKDADTQNNENRTTENKNNKVWIEKDSETFYKAKEAIQSGKFTINDVKRKYNISKEVEKLLLEK